MSDDFAINYISIMNGRYIFHNGMVKKRIEEISELQILEHLHDMLDQAKHASAALLAKQNNS